MHILAVSDLDILGKNIEKFFAEMKKQKEPDLLLLAGDMYEWSKPIQYKEIKEFIENLGWKCPIIAVPGNREFDSDIDKIKKYCKDRIFFLDDKVLFLEICGKKIGIIGSRGCLDEPTFWQVENFVGIIDSFENRRKWIDKEFKKMSIGVHNTNVIKILLTHYSPTYKTLVGENEELWGVCGSELLEKILIKNDVDLAIHGHAHFGKGEDKVGKTKVYNASFRIRNGPVEIKV